MGIGTEPGRELGLGVEVRMGEWGQSRGATEMERC